MANNADVFKMRVKGEDGQVAEFALPVEQAAALADGIRRWLADRAMRMTGTPSNARH